MIWFWLGFLAMVGAFLALDLGVFHRKSQTVSIREALAWSAIWIATSLLFSVFIYLAYSGHWLGLGLPDPAAPDRLDTHAGLTGHQAWLKYVTGYVVEWSLSVDNIFVIALIFGYFKIPAKYQHRVLFWGILGAILMRGGFILVGDAVIQRFHYVLYLFGAFLIFTAYKMLTSDDDPDPSKSRVLRQLYRRFNVTNTIHGSRFVVFAGEMSGPEASVAAGGEVPAAATGERDVGAKHGAERIRTGHRVLTPLAVALVIVEVTDLIFAIDSIPAIYGVTQDSYLVFTSNIFAVLGLRSMYFALAELLHKFHRLKGALAVILGLVGGKMLAGDWIEHDLHVSDSVVSLVTLLAVVGLLAGGVVASLVFPKRDASLKLAA